MLPGKLWDALNGSKTYLCVGLWMLYNIGAKKGLWVADDSINVVLLGGAGLSASHAIHKNGDSETGGTKP